ncbi:MAG: hypothetical protein V1658_04060, partial [Candidatus Micrarchaeota archaeon]
MVSVFIKAGVIVLLVFIGNVLVVKNIEDGRQAEVQEKLAKMEREGQTSKLMLLYMQTLDKEDAAALCPALDSLTSEQILAANNLAYQIDKYREANLIASLEEARERYILNSVELWLYLKQLEEVCGMKKLTPILYFYPEKAACPECKVQADILNSYRDRCTNVRV